MRACAIVDPISPAFLRLVNLEAARTGSTATSVLLFATVPEDIGPAMSATSTAADGTVISIIERGVYAFSIDAWATAADGTAFGVTKNTNAAGTTGVPTLGTVGIITAGLVLPNASETPNIHLSGTFYVSQAEASVAGGALMRFVASDDGGGVPGELVIGSVVAQIQRVANWPA